MLDSQRFPPDALEILKQVRWQPDARIEYEGFSGGLVWSDEFPREAVDAFVGDNSCAYRFLIGYRASLTRCKLREELREGWDQLAAACPDWPGFRPERRSPELLPVLEAENARFLSEFEVLID